EAPFVFVSPTPEISNPASGAWVGMQLTARPTGTSIAGLTVAELNRHRVDGASWCFASALSERSFVSSDRAVQQAIEETFRERSNAFQVSGNFTGRGPELALVGMYQDCSGVIGSFLLIVSTSSPRQIRYLYTFEEGSGVNFIWLQEGSIHSSNCLACDVISAL